jgi:hypothetical protein
MSPASTLAFRTLAFGDVDGRFWGAAVQSSQAGLAFGSGDRTRTAPAPAWTVEDRAWSLSGEGYELHIEPRGEAPAEPDSDGDAPADVSGLQELCRVHGRLSIDGAEQIVDCGGTRTEIDGLKPGSIASVRAVSGWFGLDEAITLIALRSSRASDHEADLVAAMLFDHDGWVPVSDPRLSTTYTEAGDPARAGLELWVSDGENEFPRRAAGEAAGRAVAFTAGELALRVAPMRCHSRGLEGAGVYVLASL